MIGPIDGAFFIKRCFITFPKILSKFLMYHIYYSKKTRLSTFGKNNLRVA